MTIFNPVYDGSNLMCTFGGMFTTSDVTTKVKMMGKFIVLEGAEFGSPSPPCTKQASTSGALPNCSSFLPATTLSLSPKFEGKKCVVNFSLQFAKENMIPAFIYDSFTASSGEPRVT